MDTPVFPSLYFQYRNKLVKWIIQIYEKLFFKPETLYRAISLFDVFIAIRKEDDNQIDLNELKLAIVACLSISIKLNEVNSNYSVFLTDNILNPQSGQINRTKLYSYEELYIAESEIIYQIDYNVNFANVYHFNSIFLQVCLMELNDNSDKDAFINLNAMVLRSFVLSDYSVQLSPIDSAVMVLNETLRNYPHKDKESYQMMIINKIQMLFFNKKASRSSEKKRSFKKTSVPVSSYTRNSVTNDETESSSIVSPSSFKVEE